MTMTRILNVQKNYFNSVKKLNEETIDSIKSILCPFVENGESISWYQYTPYFNDGNPCEFSIYNDTSSLLFDNQNYWAFSVKTISKYDEKRRKYYEVDNPDYDPTILTKLKKFSTKLQEFEEDFLKMVFGDHKKITVTSTSIFVENFDHE